MHAYIICMKESYIIIVQGIIYPGCLRRKIDPAANQAEQRISDATVQEGGYYSVRY